MEELAKKIRNIPDFPKKGILFRDITPLLQDSSSFRRAVDLLSRHYQGKELDLVVSVEARGFILGAPLAYKLGLGFVPVRKPGKLPYKVERTTYELEYGQDTIEIHQDAIRRGDRVLVFDDLLATGGTARGICDLVEKLGGKIAGVCFLIELTSLKGRDKLKEYDVFSLIKF
ncbi:adenine phosphoribosyltransferase [Candidatus Aerophobetes bacterium]|nr:adenine phosphoribosyltransferase [Candidatus Aerophobetes bacterium]